MPATTVLLCVPAALSVSSIRIFKADKTAPQAIQYICIQLLFDVLQVSFFPWRWGGSSTQAWMPTYVSILRIPQMIWGAGLAQAV
jgi:hypothetical protein